MIMELLPSIKMAPQWQRLMQLPLGVLNQPKKKRKKKKNKS